MTNTNNTEREKFEAWAITHGYFSDEDDSGTTTINFDEQMWLAWQAALAQKNEVVSHPDDGIVIGGWQLKYAGKDWVLREVYDNTSPPKQAIPDGWKLVPIEPTEQMKNDAVKFAGDIILQEVYPNGKYKQPVSLDSEMFGEAYKAMLSASPLPPNKGE